MKLFEKTEPNWSYKSLDEIADIIPGNSPPGNSYNEDGRGVPFIQGAKAMGDEKPDTKKYTTEPTKLTQSGDIILASRATVGDTNISDKEYCIGRGVIAVRINNEVDINYINHYLKYINSTKYWESISKGGTYTSITKSDVQELEVPVPPLGEQERIVREIEERLDTITTLEHSINNIQQLSNEYEDSIINFLFAGRRFSSKDSVSEELQSSELPDSWSIKKIDDCILSAKNGGTPKKSEDSYWGGEIGWLNSGDVRDKYTSEPSEFITQKALDETSAKMFEENSVLVAMYGGEGTIGRATILTEELSGNQAICSLVPDETIIDIEYFYYCFKRIRPKLEYLARGGSQSNINQGIVREQKIPVPPLEVQKEIVARLEEIDFSELENSISIVDELSQEYKDSVLSEAFSGNI